MLIFVEVGVTILVSLGFLHILGIILTAYCFSFLIGVVYDSMCQESGLKVFA